MILVRLIPNDFVKYLLTVKLITSLLLTFMFNMDCIATRLPYRQTGAFTKIALDYIDQADNLRQFFSHPPTLQGIKTAIESRKNFANREVLVQALNKQYASIADAEKVISNIEALKSGNTFTVTTAHQNNIFTGPLYFIYKILHSIRLAEHLIKLIPGSHFVPVFYMGSEDADLDELNNIQLGGEKLVWNTNQTGAVGRMKVDKDLLRLVEIMEGQLSVQPHGTEILELIREAYTAGTTIQDATFRFVHSLFGQYGLIILIADSPELKKLAIPLFEDELLNQSASDIVNKSAEQLEAAGYKVQAQPRDINLFYLGESSRERIELKDGHYQVLNTTLSFSREEILAELHSHPERFSPNVIMRGLYQESILPNLAFIGGAGETAYWLQLKNLFDHYQVPFPVLVLRNSFLIIEEKWRERIEKIGISQDELFLPGEAILDILVNRNSNNEIKLNGSLTQVEQLYESFKKQATAVDSTLEKHVDALRLNTVRRLHELEKKMLRAEKRKFSDQKRQIQTIKSHLFPGDGLQERYDNIAYYYSKWGREIIAKLYDKSLALEQEFVILNIR